MITINSHLLRMSRQGEIVQSRNDSLTSVDELVNSILHLGVFIGVKYNLNQFGPIISFLTRHSLVWYHRFVRFIYYERRRFTMKYYNIKIACNRTVYGSDAAPFPCRSVPVYS